MSAEDYIPDFGDGEEAEDELLTYEKIEAETKRAFLLRTKRGSCWIAKSVITEHDRDERYVTFPGWVNLIYVTGSSKSNAFRRQE